MDVPQFRGETVEMVRLASQERVQWIDEQMEEMFSSKEEFLTKMEELRTQLDERPKKIDALWVHKSRILGQIEDHVAEGGGSDPCLILHRQIGVLMEEKGHVRKFRTTSRDFFELRTQAAGLHL